ncbi:acyltransferase family protein [Aureimonas flava]|nr:acyltransferase [Aureimonas flava]
MTRHYLALDGMRGVAALAVVLYHIAAVPHLRAPSGYLAVDFFFALSGFVIAHAYRRRLLDGMSFAEFTMLRIARLYPVLLLGFLLASMRGAALLLLGDPGAPSIEELVSGSTLNLVLLPTPIVGAYMFLNVPAWSLMFEIIANLAYARWVGLLTSGALVGVLLVSGVLLVPVAYAGLFGAGGTIDTFHVGLVRVIFSFSMGLLLHGLRERFPALTLNPYLLVALLFAALAAPIAHPLYDLVFVVVLTPAFLILGANSRSFLGAKWLGEISYPVYALHYSLLSIGSLAAGKAGIPPWVGMVGLVAAFCLATPLLTQFYDIPFRQRLRQAMGRALALAEPRAGADASSGRSA